MPLSCPVCKAENATGPACRRCKADLSMLFAIGEHQAALLASARQALREGRLSDAWKHALAANAQRADAESLRLVAMLQWIHGNYAEAWRAYRARESHA